MKFKYTLLVISILLVFQGFSQNNLSKAGGTSNDESMDVATDQSGNMYSCGYISNFVSFGNLTVSTPQGQSDIYVSKQSNTGSFLWVKRFAGVKDERAYDIYVDATGNIYITGYFYGTTHFDSFTLTSNAGSRDLFVAKLDNNGNVLWAKQLGGTNGETGYGVCTDSQGNVILTGQFREQITVGTNTYTTPISPITNYFTFDLLLVKFDPSGNVLWSKVGSSDGENRGLAVICNPDDEIVITGQFSDTFTLAGVLFNNQGYNLGLLAKFSPSGTLNWMHKMLAGQVMAYDLTLNSAKEIYVTGDFKGNGFSYLDGAGNHYLNSTYLYNLFILKVGNNGSFIWGQQDGSNNEVSSQGIDLDVNENPYICGMFKCKMGEYSDALSSDSGYFYSMGYRDVFVSKYDAQGQRQWFRQYGGPKDDYCSGISISGVNAPVLSGSFERYFFAQFNAPFSTSDLSTIHFGSQCSGSGSTYRLNSMGSIDNKDIFVGRINSFGLSPTSYFSPQCSSFYYPEITSDTIEFCAHGQVCLTSHAQSNSYSPIFNINWSNGDTHQCTQELYSNTSLVVTIDREDQCYSNIDSVEVIIHPIPPMPLLTDNHGLNNANSLYIDIGRCFPDSTSTWLTNIDTNNTYNWQVNGTNLNITDTSEVSVNSTYAVTVTSPFGCTNYEDYKCIFITVDTPIVVKPYIRMVDNYDMNDSIRICPGIPVSFVGKDSLTNNAYFSPFCTYYGYVDQHWTSSIPMVDPDPFIAPPYCLESSFVPTTTGWYTVKLEMIWGGMNICGVDTIHQIVVDSFYIEVVPPPVINLSTNSIVCPGDIGYATVDTTFVGLNWWTFNGEPFTLLPGGDSIAINHQDTAVYGGNFMYQTDVFCTVKVMEEIDFYENPSSISNIPDNIICPNDSILLTCEPGLNYEWIGPQGQVIDTTQSIYASIPGYYHCNQTNFAGCLLPSNFIELKGYATPILTVSPDQYICSGESAVITITTVGAPTFNWLNPAGYTNSTLQVNSPGTYVCEISQCGFTITDSAEIFDASFSIALNVSNDSTICFGDSVLLNVNPTYSMYQWSIGNGGSYYTYANQSGDYFVNATNGYGCVAYSDTFSLEINHGSELPSYLATTICSGDNAVFVYNDTNQVYWYKDSLGNNLIGISDTLIIANLLSDTTIYLLQYNGNCYSEVVSATTHVSSISNGISITGDTTICYGSSLVLNGPSDGNAQWSGPGGYTSNSDSAYIVNATSPNQNGIYHLLVTEGNCQREDSINVLVYNQINTSLDTNGTLYICPGSSIDIGVVDSSYSVIWYPLGSVSPGITANNPGNYYAHFTDSLGCSAESDSVTVAFYQDNTPILNDTSICFATNFIFNDTSMYQLSWYDSLQNFIGYEDLSLSNVQSDTSFYYVYTDTVSNCPHALSLFTVHIMPPNPPTIVGDTLICANVTATFNASYQTDGTSVWSSIDTTITVTGNNISFSVPTDTSFYLILTTTGSQCSNGADSLFIHAVLPNTPIVADSMMVFCSDSTSNWVVNYNSPFDSLIWNSDLGYVSYGDTADFIINQTIYSNASVYAIDTNGCQSNAATFYAIQAVQAQYNLIQDSTTCIGDTLIAYGNSPNAANSFWTTPNNTIQSDTIQLYDLQVNNSGYYSFTAIDSSGCVSVDSFYIEIDAPYVFDLDNDTTLCSGDQIIYTSPVDSNFIWSGFDPFDQQQVLTNSATLILTVWTGTFCPYSDTVAVQFVQCSPVAPNVVTANGDGMNDLFKIKDAQYMFDDYLIIYNRWGDVVYETYEYKNDFNAAQYNLNEGTYFYKYYRTWNPKDQHPLNGFFEVIR